MNPCCDFFLKLLYVLSMFYPVSFSYVQLCITPFRGLAVWPIQFRTVEVELLNCKNSFLIMLFNGVAKGKKKRKKF